MYNVIRRFFKRVARLISWLPVIWDDYDYSAEPGIYNLILFKLRKVKHEMFIGYSVLEHGEMDDITRAIELAEKIATEKEYDELFKKLTAGKEGPYLVPVEGTDSKQMVFPEGWNTGYRKARDIWDKKLVRYKRELFKLLSTEAMHWWD